MSLISWEVTSMSKHNIKKIAIILAHAFVGWAQCGAIVFIGRGAMSLQATLITHAIGAPIIFAVVSWIYFRKFNYTTPLKTAIVFVTFVIFVDFFVVALLIERSFEMFLSWLGTWLPWALLFTSTYVTGLYMRKYSMSRGVV
jgi:hypothetical protein